MDNAHIQAGPQHQELHRNTHILEEEWQADRLQQDRRMFEEQSAERREWSRHRRPSKRVLKGEMSQAYRSAELENAEGMATGIKERRECRNRLSLSKKAAKAQNTFFDDLTETTHEADSRLQEEPYDNLKETARVNSALFSGKERDGYYSKFLHIQDEIPQHGNTEVERVRFQGAELQKRKDAAAAEIRKAINILKDIDLDSFNIADDKDFIKQYHTLYPKLVAGAALEDSIKEYLHLGSLMELRERDELSARGRVFAELKDEFDDRMRLIRNPYYSLLNESSFDGKTEEELNHISENSQDAVFRSYIELIIRKRQRANAGGMQARYTGKLEEVRHERLDYATVFRDTYVEQKQLLDNRFGIMPGEEIKHHVPEGAALRYAGVLDRTPTQRSVIEGIFFARTHKSYTDVLNDEDVQMIEQIKDEYTHTLTAANTMENGAAMIREMFAGIMEILKTRTIDGQPVSGFRNFVCDPDDPPALKARTMANAVRMMHLIKDFEQIVQGHPELGALALEGTSNEDMKRYAIMSFYANSAPQIFEAASVINLFAGNNEHFNEDILREHVDHEEDNIMSRPVWEIHTGFNEVSGPEIRAFNDSIAHLEQSGQIDDLHVPMSPMMAVAYKMTFMGGLNARYSTYGNVNEVRMLNNPDVMNYISFGRGANGGRLEWNNGHFQVVMNNAQN